MAEKVQQAAKTTVAKRENSASKLREMKCSQSMNSPVDQVLYLQRTIGNQSVQRLIKSGALQTKLKIGQSGDKYEQEADRTADTVNKMPEMHFQQQTDEGDELFQAKPIDKTAHVINNIESGIQSLTRSGQLMSQSERTYFEPRFGRDFNQVHMHTDVKANESAKAVNAKAFTVGNDVVFGAGEYAPETMAGRQLIAHELTHVVQQRSPPLLDTLQRFSYGEHQSVGDIGSRGKYVLLFKGSKNLTKYEISYGEMVALAGDYFGSLDSMKRLASTASGQRQLDYARSKGGTVKKPIGITKEEEKKIDKLYYKLNMKNFHHFSQTTTHNNNNLDFYLKGHEKAMNEAFMAGNSKKSINEALLIESFHTHFLTDAFTGGHITSPRQAASEHWGNIYPLFVENFFNHLAEHMATQINDKTFWAGMFKTIAGLKSIVISEVKSLAPAGVSGYSLGGLISLAIHDWYNKRGLDVVSEVDASGKTVKGGYKWKAFGEIKKLDERIAQEQKRMVISAVESGLEDVNKTYQCNNLKCFKKIGSESKVVKYVPKVDPTSKSNIDFKWKFSTIDDLVKNKEIMVALKEMVGPKGDIGKMLLGASKKLPTSKKGTNPQAAFHDWLSRFWSNTDLVLKEIANYVPGGTGHHYSSDNMSRDYIKDLSKKGRLEELTTIQMVGLIKKMLKGATGDKDETSILKVLRAANKKGNVYEVVNQVGGFWRLEKDFQGEEWHSLLKVLTEKYFRILPNKVVFIRWLVDNTYREWGEEACIAILNATTTSEFKYIVNKITKKKLDSFLDGAEQKRFDELLRVHNYP